MRCMGNEGHTRNDDEDNEDNSDKDEDDGLAWLTSLACHTLIDNNKKVNENRNLIQVIFSVNFSDLSTYAGRL